MPRLYRRVRPQVCLSSGPRIFSDADFFKYLASAQQEAKHHPHGINVNITQCKPITLWEVLMVLPEG